METIKEEKKADLEQLLNSLIKKGWKPRQHTNFVRCNYCDIYSEFSFETENESGIGEYTLRALVSKESNLWQFVCENGMIPKENHERVYDVSWGEYGVDCKAQIISREPEYRLIETSLKNEDELEQFLLDNIIINEQA